VSADDCEVDYLIKAFKSFKGGIKPGHHKETSEKETVKMPLPSKVVIPMLQHIARHACPL
jgi:electron transport complex protein RnfC